MLFCFVLDSYIYIGLDSYDKHANEGFDKIKVPSGDRNATRQHKVKIYIYIYI